MKTALAILLGLLLTVSSYGQYKPNTTYKPIINKDIVVGTLVVGGVAMNWYAAYKQPEGKTGLYYLGGLGLFATGAIIGESDWGKKRVYARGNEVGLKFNLCSKKR